MKHYVFSVDGNDNDDANPNNISLLSKTQNYMFLFSLKQQKQSRSIATSKQRIWKISVLNIKQKVRLKTQQMSIDVWSNQTFQEFTDCSFWFI